MKQDTLIVERYSNRPTGCSDQLIAPLGVFYVVQTTGKVIGKRHHCIRSLLYETWHQAQGELLQLRATNARADTDTYDIWKGVTYIEPAEWMSDVVMKDGTKIHVNHRAAQPTAELHAPSATIA